MATPDPAPAPCPEDCLCGGTGWFTVEPDTDGTGGYDPIIRRATPEPGTEDVCVPCPRLALEAELARIRGLGIAEYARTEIAKAGRLAIEAAEAELAQANGRIMEERGDHEATDATLQACKKELAKERERAETCILCRDGPAGKPAVCENCYRSLVIADSQACRDYEAAEAEVKRLREYYDANESLLIASGVTESKEKLGRLNKARVALKEAK